MLPEITPAQLHEWRQQNIPHQLVDVREPEEWEYCNLGGELIPLGDLPKHIAKIRTDVPIVLLCHHGYRSGQALNYLQHTTGQANFYNLRGGIHAWAQQIDPTMPVY